MTSRLALLPVLALASALAFAQSTPAKVDPPKEPTKEAPKEPPKKPSTLKEYKSVITAEAVSSSGLFKVHRMGDKVYWEIPKSVIGKELLWQTELSQTPTNRSYSGETAGVRVVRFERRNDRLFLRNVDYSIRSESPEFKRSIEISTVEPIIAAFDVQTEGDGAAPVIDITSFLLNDPSDFSVRGLVRGAGVDTTRSYIERQKAFENNVETRVFLTFMAAPGGRSALDVLLGMGGGPSVSAASVVVHHSVVRLPDKPMMGRLKDSRIGYFTTDFTAYGRPQNASESVRYINRFRLEKKDPSASLSEPVKPIVIYLGREVPERWRKYVKQGIEDWQPAFEAAGFKNAIVAMDPPTVEQDPDWDAEDARYSVIRFIPSTTANAMGPSVQDPRSGETISSHIIVWNDIFSILHDWYFAQAAAVDPRARKLPFADDLMGELLRYVVAHEVGHGLGLEHNFRSSSAYTVAQLRDPEFTRTMGLSPSIMDYSRFNYVAQPGDGVTRLIGGLGPYDRFAIQYGYTQLPGVLRPEDEKSWLDKHLAQQISRPELRFANYRFPNDAATQTEDIGSNAVEATTLGLKNLDVIASRYLIPGTVRFGEDYDRLQEGWSALLLQRSLMLNHVVANLGGYVETNTHGGRGSDVFRPVEGAKQWQALRFLTTTGLATPKTLYAPTIVNKLRPEGVITATTQGSERILSGLLDDGRARRLVEAKTLHPTMGTPSVDDVVKATFSGTFSELATSASVDPYRRSLQRALIRIADGKANGASSDLRLAVRDELRQTAKRIDAAAPKVSDRLTKLHLADTRREIERILTAKPSAATSSGPSLLDLLLGGATNANRETCAVCFPKRSIEPLANQ